MRYFLLLSIIALAITAHAQSKSYIFVFLHKKANISEVAKDTVEHLMKGHMENMERLAREEKLLAAGPFEGGGGIFILNTTSKEEANEWIKTDPGIQANRWDVEMLEYSPQVGSICPVKEPYEMVTYDFIRFSETSNNQLLEHQQRVQQESENGNVVTAGQFKPSGNILILKTGVKEKFLATNPAVQGGHLKPEAKKLWIARGSFCEK